MEKKRKEISIPKMTMTVQIPMVAEAVSFAAAGKEKNPGSVSIQ